MMATSQPNIDTLPLAKLRQIDDACRRFEAMWLEAGVPEQRPRIEAFLDAVPESARLVLLGELVSLEIELRRHIGERPELDDYRARFPFLTPSPDETELEGPASVPRAPPVVRGYEIIEELGRGGMAVVYKARQTDLQRLVALKMIIAGEHAGPQALERFHVEAEAIARLQHPHIVQIHEIGVHEGLPYICLEFCPGGSLDKKLKDNPMPPRPAAETVEKLASAVSSAHQKGILHRDLKPANVLLAEDGSPKITDFGLAKNTDPNSDREGLGSQLTHTNTIMGTPSYMSPEQALGASKSVGPAADVYSLGAILYNCLTGRPPFQGASILETLDQVRAQDPVPPRQLNPNIPTDLDTICLKCLRKEPGKRYTSAGELAADLRRYLDGKPIQARPVSSVERSWKWVRRHPVETGLATTVLLLIAALAVGALVKNAELSKALAHAEQAKNRSEELSNQAHARLWESLRERGRAMRMSRVPGQRLESIRSIREAVQLPTPPGHSVDELRTEAIAAFALPDVELVREWEGHPAGTAGLDFDGAFERYARLASDGTVSVHRLSDNEKIVSWREPTQGPWPINDTNVRFSPDGRFVCIVHTGTANFALPPGVAGSRSGRLVVRRVEDGGASICHCANNCIPWDAMDFSPDSERLAYILADGRIAIVSLSSGQTHYLPATGAEDQQAMSFAPEGRRLALAVQRKGKWAIEVRDAATGEVQQTLRESHGRRRPAWHPDGRLLAASGDDRQIRIWDVAANRILRKLEGHKTFGINCVFSQTGDRLLSNDWAHVLRVWEPSSGRQLFSIGAHNFNFLRLSTNDCVPALTAGNSTKLQLLRLYMGLEYRTILPPDDPKIAVDPSGNLLAHPDGRLVAAPGFAGSPVVILDLKAGRYVASLGQGSTVPLCWEDRHNLLTCGPAGVLRWPLRADPDEHGHYRLGPPTRLLEYGIYANYGISADTQIIAVPAGDNGALVARRGPPNQILKLEDKQQDVRTCAVSPDGRWVATGSHNNTDGFGAKVWNAATGALLEKLPVPGLCKVAFSPDGLWLLTMGGGCRLWKVDAWDQTHFVGGTIGCFSPDGSVLAVDDGAGVIRLVSTANGDTLVRLEAPEQACVQPRVFTPDGAKLLAFGADTLALHVWDLRAIRRGLLELGLESGLPEYPPLDETAPQPIRIDVELKPDGR